jgi:hypothetical protein
MKSASLLVLLAAAALAQEDNTRQLWNPEFLNKRPAAPSSTSTQAKPKANYKPAGPTKPSGPAGSGTMVGITLWEIRDAKANDAPGTRLLVIPGTGDQKEGTQERVDLAAPITKTERYRFTFEMPTKGYLYVIDREKFADGKLGDPYIIYPTGRMRPEDNVVAPGRLLEVPDRLERPNYFVIEAKPGQVAEVLSFLVMPEPIPDLNIGRQALRVDPERYAAWQKTTTDSPERFVLEGGTGGTITASENKAAADRDKKVTQADPLPQTLYRVAGKPGAPVLLEIPLTFKK